MTEAKNTARKSRLQLDYSTEGLYEVRLKHLISDFLQSELGVLKCVPGDVNDENPFTLFLISPEARPYFQKAIEDFQRDTDGEVV